RVGHVRVEAALFFPELADPGTLFGFNTCHNAIDIRLMSASMITVWKVILIYTGEELPDNVDGYSGGRPLRFVSSGLLRSDLFFGGAIFRSIGHDTFVDEVGLLFHSGDEPGVLFRNVV
mgnify:CR=1